MFDSFSVSFYLKVWNIERERMVDFGKHGKAGREEKDRTRQSIRDCVSA